MASPHALMAALYVTALGFRRRDAIARDGERSCAPSALHGEEAIRVVPTDSASVAQVAQFHLTQTSCSTWNCSKSTDWRVVGWLGLAGGWMEGGYACGGWF